MLIRAILLFLCLSLASAGVVAKPKAEPSATEAFIDSEWPGSALPGFAYATIDGEDVHFGARGKVNADEDAKVSPSTPFLLGSISKSFTALAVMQLVEAGKVELDEPIATYLPAFKGKANGQITVRQLLSHMSGYSTLQGNSAPAESDNGAKALERRAQWYAGVEAAYKPGTHWEYSNGNYVVLGRLVEVESGQPFADYIEQNILAPLKMDDSYVSARGKQRGMATGHTPWFGTMRAIPSKWVGAGFAPQGGVVSSARDLARYLQMMMNGKDDIVSAASKRQMMSPASEASSGYGLGWMLNGEEKSVYHTGTSPGFETIVAMIPSKRRGVVVLTNGGSGMGFAETTDLRYGIVARALGLPSPEGSGRPMRIVNFLMFAIAPVFFLIAIGWAWRHRDGLRKKTRSAFGLFSLWFPLAAMAGLAWVCLSLIPGLFGTSLSSLNLFVPDFVLLIEATAVLGLLWAIVRLVLAYSGRRTEKAAA